MSKYILALTVFFAFTNTADAQIKVEGEKQATVGYMLKLKLTQLQVDDPQIKCFPDNPDWIATKDFAGQAFIIFVPGKKAIPAGRKETLYTFVIAGNKAGKTYLETHEVTVRSDGEEPDVSQLHKDLKAAYLVSPSAEAKAKLIQVYEAFLADVEDDKFKTFKEAGDSLALVTPKFVGTELKAVRDVVGAYFRTEVGQTGWNKDKLSRAVKKVIESLKSL